MQHRRIFVAFFPGPCYTAPGDLMKNIPVYMARGGTASLILKEIPHRAVAYVLLRTIRDREDLIRECADFCRSCGAEEVLFSRGPEPLEGLEHAYDMLRLAVRLSDLPDLDCPLRMVPMEENNDAIYQRLYNLCFTGISGAATYDRAEIARIYREGQQAYLALDEGGNPCGMGELHGNELAAVGLLPEYRGRGLSKSWATMLLKKCPGPEAELTVVSNNEPALGLYGALGFRVKGKVSAWYWVR